MEIDILEHMKPELLLKVPPALNVIGAVLKAKGKVKGKNIQFMLILISVVFTLMYVLGLSELHTYQEWILAIVFSITQGIIFAGAAMGTHEIIKNDKTDGGENSE